MTNAKQILEQQKAICWQNKIRKADADGLMVSWKLRLLRPAAAAGAKGRAAPQAGWESEAEDGSWAGRGTWQLQGRASSFPAVLSLLTSLQPNQWLSANQSSLFQATLLLQNKMLENYY